MPKNPKWNRFPVSYKLIPQSRLLIHVQNSSFGGSGMLRKKTFKTPFTFSLLPSSFAFFAYFFFFCCLGI